MSSGPSDPPHSHEPSKPPLAGIGPTRNEHGASRNAPRRPEPIPLPELEGRESAAQTAGRRKLTATLSSLFGAGKAKRDESAGSGGSDEAVAGVGSTARVVSTVIPHGPRRASASETRRAEHPPDLPTLDRRATHNNSSLILPPSPLPNLSSSPPSSTPSTTTPRRSKPPVSLQPLFRSRLSSADSAPPSDEALVAPHPTFLRDRRSSSRERINQWASRSVFFSRRNSGPTSSHDVETTTTPSRARAMSEEITRPAMGFEGNGLGMHSYAASSVMLPRPAAIERGASGGSGGTTGSGSTGSDSTRESLGRRGGFFRSESGDEGDEELDVGDFARGSTSPASSTFSSVSITRPKPTGPLFPSSPRRPKLTESSRITANESVPECAATLDGEPRVATTSAHVYPPRQTRNIDNLHLSDFARISPPLSLQSSPTAIRESPPPPPSPPPISLAPSPAVPVTLVSTSPAPILPHTSIPTGHPPSPRSTATARRLGALPRLLSTGVDSFPSLANMARTNDAHSSESELDEEGGEVGDDGEMETETETDTDDDVDSDDGEAFTSAEEESSSPPGPSSSVQRQSPSRFTQGSTTPRLGFAGLSMTAVPALPPFPAPAKNWVTFDPTTPTPGPLHTARPTDSDNTGGSYFDLPGRSAQPRTPGAPMMSPLLPMTMSQTARGKRPTRQEQGSVASPPLSDALSPASLGPIDAAGATSRKDFYLRKSSSAVAILSPGLGGDDGEEVGTAGIEGLDPIWRAGNAGALPTPAPAFLSATPRVLTRTPTATTPGVSGTLSNCLHRPRSMYELHDEPPTYHAVYRRPGLQDGQRVFPREEEGKEPLPSYSCDIHLQGYFPRKLEFSSPTVQAKDRSWKRVYVVLHGTAIKIYKYDLRTHPIEGEEDLSVASPDVIGSGPPPLHFHIGEYGADGGGKGKFPTSIEDAKILAKNRIVSAASSQTNVVLRHYSLQAAESGLAADYVKRPHTVRIRAEGEQFLLQAKDDRGVLDLVEALQAATNVALDLDTRLPPKFITLPRRRRRRRRPADAAATAVGIASTQTLSVTPRPLPGNDSILGDMLSEEQTAYAQRSSATVM